MASLSYYAVCVASTVATLYFLAIRIMELIDATAQNPLVPFMGLAAVAGLGSLFMSPAVMWSQTVRRLGLIFLVIAQLKSAIDGSIKQGIPARNLANQVAIVTGANSGTGYAVVKHLMGLNCQVVMTCRSKAKCQTAVDSLAAINPAKAELLHPMIMDLSDLQSVHNFVAEFNKKFRRLDILVNNAGLVAAKNSFSKQGLEESFGAMHVGHFALTKWLLPTILKPLPAEEEDFSAARVVNVASEAWVNGNFHSSFMSPTGKGDLEGEICNNCENFGPGDMLSCCPIFECPFTNGYARAKLSNVLHAQELQRRFDEHVNQTNHKMFHKKYRRLVTSSLHPGTVSTNIAALLKFSQYFARSGDDGGLIILHAILDNTYVPSSFIDSMKNGHDLSGYRESHLKMHLTAYPQAEKLPFNNFPLLSFQFHNYHWDKKEFLRPLPEDLKEKKPKEVANMVAARLWDLSEQIVHDWEEKKALLQTPVLVSKRNLF